MATKPSTSSRTLASVFDADVAKALTTWAAGKDGTVRLPHELWLAKGYTGDILGAVVLETTGLRGPTSAKLIVKVLPSGAPADEPAHHHRAWKMLPEFAAKHFVKQVDSRYPVGDGRFLMFQEIAGSLIESHTLGQLPLEHLAAACRQVATLWLQAWKTSPGEHRVEAGSVADFLGKELGDALSDGRSARLWASRMNLFDSDNTWITIGEDGDAAMPNPYFMAERSSELGGIKVDYLVGPAHSDLHLDNVLITYRPPNEPCLDEIRFIDLSTFDPNAPVTRDFVTLMLSVIMRTSVKAIDYEADALINLVIDPRDRPAPVLKPVTVDAVQAIYEVAERASEGWADEWRMQYLLSVQAQAIIHTSYDAIGAAMKRWCLRLAACAADAFVARRTKTFNVTDPHRIDDGPVLAATTKTSDDLGQPGTSVPKAGTTRARIERRQLLIGGGAALAASGGAGLAVARALRPDSSTPTVRASAEYLWYPDDGLMFATDNVLAPAESRHLEESVGPEQVTATARTLGAVRIAMLHEGGIPTSQFSRVQLVLRGNREDTAVIRGIHARVFRREAPLSGTLLYGGTEGEAEVIPITFDLDSDDHPIAHRPRADGRPSESPYIENNYIELKPRETQVLLATAHTTQHYCEWEIELDIDGDEDPQVIRDADGRLFMTTAFSEASYSKTYSYDLARQRFTLEPGNPPLPWEP